MTVCSIAEGSLTEAWAHQCPEPAPAVIFSPDGSHVAAAADAVRVWRTRDGSACDALPESAQRSRGIAYDRTGRRLAAAGADGAVRVWDAAANVLLHILAGHKGVVHAAAFSPSSGLLATAGADGTIGIWDPDRGRHLLSLTGWECRARVLAFSPADGTLAIGGTDGVRPAPRAVQLDSDTRLARPCARDHRDVLRPGRTSPRDGRPRWDRAHLGSGHGLSGSWCSGAARALGGSIRRWCRPRERRCRRAYLVCARTVPSAADPARD